MEERDPMTPGTVTGQAGPAQPGRPRRGWFWLAAVAAATAGAAVVVVLLALSGGKSTAGGTAAAGPPQPASNFSIPVLGHPGQRLTLAAYAGKPVIVNFFASWCSPCQRETPLLASYYRASHGRVTILGIDVNDPAGNALAFVHRKGVSYPVGVDAPPMPTAAAYNVSGLPQTFFLNAQHRVVKRVFGAVTHQELTAGTALIDNRTK